MENLLSIQEIKLIERNAANPVMKLPNVIGFMGGERFHLTIATISKKGLIFIIGNQSTGLSHIQRRHYFNSYPKDWTEYKDQKGEVIEKRDYIGDKLKRLDNPGRFDMNDLPEFEKIIKEYENAELPTAHHSP